MPTEDNNSVITLYSDVTAREVNWVWFPYIALGKITLLQGDPGDGKSTMMMNLIADMTKGRSRLQGQKFQMPQRVIYQCSEDGVADTIRPRLDACNADCTKVAFINEEINSGLTLDDERIRRAIIAFRPSMVVIDPIQAYLGNDSDLQIAGRARKLMHRLGLWASTYDCAIVLVGHLNKKEGSKGLYRSLGSIDVVAAARSVLQVSRDEENSDVRIVKQIKNSLAIDGGEIRFKISRDYGFEWMECSEQEETPIPITDQMHYENKTDCAATIIKRLLSEKPVLSVEMLSALKEAGVSQRTANSTKKMLGIQCYKENGKWYWKMPEPDSM